MKNKLILIVFAIIASGCSAEAEPSTASSDLLQVDAPAKVLSAADVDFTNPYYFAYNDQVIEGYDTFKNTNPISVTAEQDTTLTIYGANEPVEDLEFETPIEEVELSAGSTYTLQSNYIYYQINSSTPTTGSISVM